MRTGTTWKTRARRSGNTSRISASGSPASTDPMGAIPTRGRVMIVLAGVMCGASTAFAQIPSTKPYGSLMVIREVVPVERPWLPRIGDVVAPPLLTPMPARGAVRPAPRALLPSLYVGDIALQILDSHST